ncbi:MAG TPA: acetate--CoA ligase family protein [Kofleriaceae bacterium]|jgi:hypothetical protein|nr:acetate--CoA ligase family protein [Kofleriaceae bacterium]
MTAQAASRAKPLARVRLIAPAALGETALAALRTRGITAAASPTATIADLVDGEQLAWALETPPSASAAAELAPLCARAAEAGRPVCMLAPPPRGSGRAAIEHAAALAYLRAHGAAIGHDIDAWLEAIAMLARIGMPAGPRVAVIAPPGSWLHAQAIAIAAEADAAGARAPQLGADKPTDVVLYDAVFGDGGGESTHALRVPVIARGELSSDDDVSDGALFGLRAALGACDLLGRAAERIAAGLGPAPASAGAELRTDDRLADRLGKLVAGNRVGDHETKALLAGYGVAITRQAVAMTPSSAVHKARRAGFPVELKPWGHDVPSEPEGCPVIKNVTSDALVRRAFTQVLAAAGRAPNQPESAVIVRETPPLGRDVAVQFVRVPALGWTVIVDAGSVIAAAPAPLRNADANALASSLVASRAADAEPDRAGLANILRRASHLVVDLDARLTRLELPRVVVGGRGSKTVVADAFALLGDGVH